MARYPSFEEYAKRNAFGEGIKRCEQLLATSPKDVDLLTTKLRLLCASKPESEDGPKVLEQLSTISPPIQDYRQLEIIEAAVVDSFRNTFPPPPTAGPVVAKLWDSAFKANTNLDYRLDLLSVRFSRAVLDNRLQDVQQALIQLKAVTPRNRAIYMAHAAYTQLLSTKKDDLQSKLAIGLARKAVNEKFDDEKALDCRVAGQIFAIQGSEKDLESIRERPAFRESKQVYEALQLHKKSTTNAEANGTGEKSDPSKVSSREWLQSEVDQLKHNFGELIDANASVEVLKEFTANSIRLFHTATTSLDLGARNRVAADPCFLAVSGLVKLFADTSDEAYLLQAAYFTESLLRFNEHVHEARLILVYIYTRLGLGGNAMRLFDSLNIKEIQFDTVGHTLFTRLSSIHPFRTKLPSEDWYEPHERTNKALQVYPRHEDKLADCECAILNHAQSGMIFELNQLRSELRHSWSRRMLLLEHRRTARLSGKGYGKATSEVGPRVLANWTQVKDNRDFNAAFNHGFNVEKALYGTNGRIPGEGWMLYSLAADVAWSLAGKQIALIIDTDNLLAALEKATASEDSDLTGAEILSSHIITKILSVLQKVKSGTSPSKDSIDVISTAVKKLPISSLIASKDLLAEHISDHYIFIDTMLIIHRTCKYIKEVAEHIPQEVASLQQTAMKIIKLLQTHATEQAAGLKVQDVVQKIQKDDVLGKEIDAFGNEDLKASAEDLVVSAKEGWEGVSRIALPS
ncbi:uncharacterized protein MYCFIDRAFT_78011 [Pseudocercospora fijiensis CIRAD86]|uniref:Uncharacterized protein n=1 Tax=Pseudocercospora fijiensis (strain CIRAD86) TaxID=383855 RepID=M2YRD6_PSEFD|nr:uncharacterized protein MYCFIDRAFT_78011 [Pseudocercospora fijiensis CIRAD86]EME80250.1 hypothetical protein MYCFIDRAFT_78011 [Pseudocercospora fijiensis CIRAD86]